MTKKNERPIRGCRKRKEAEMPFTLLRFAQKRVCLLLSLLCPLLWDWSSPYIIHDKGTPACLPISSLPSKRSSPWGRGGIWVQVDDNTVSNKHGKWLELKYEPEIDSIEYGSTTLAANIHSFPTYHQMAINCGYLYITFGYLYITFGNMSVPNDLWANLNSAWWKFWKQSYRYNFKCRKRDTHTIDLQCQWRRRTRSVNYEE